MSRKGFVWLKREITAQQQRDIHKLGVPGIGFLRENKRVYPNGPSVAHLIGLVNIDNQGIAGIEKWLDTNGLADLHRAGFASDRLQKPVELAVDLRVEHALRDELIKAKLKFSAKAASGLVSNVKTGEIVAMVSLPDFDPNNPKEAHDPDRINRLTTGVYEMGSTFKTLTLAMALDSGKVTLNSMFDARYPLSFGKFKIHDTHPVPRPISLAEVFTYSSNVGAAKIALGQGVEAHKAFLKKVGQLDRLRTELPESAMPIVPKRWGELNTITIAFGHGIAVAPLQAVIGHRHGEDTAKYQPAKLAAIEAHWDSSKPAPLVLFAWPDEEKGVNRFEIAIPGLASLLTHGSMDALFPSLNDFAVQDRPPVKIPFFGFRIMVGIGFFMIAFGWLGAWLWWRGRVFEERRWLWVAQYTWPFGFAANAAPASGAAMFTTVTSFSLMPYLASSLVRKK
eukprot:gene22603-29264_t